MADIEEIREKERRVRELMDKQGLDALAISSIANFAWFTCGGSNYVGITTEVGPTTALITRNGKYIICDNIEAPRIADEEVVGQGFETLSYEWYEGKRDSIINDIIRGGVLGSDVPMANAANIASVLDPYRYNLTAQEVERYEWLGRQVGDCLMQAAMEARPGMTEHEIAGMMNECLIARGIVPGVTLIAADERIAKYRHPLPTEKKVERYAMLVTGARKWGLIVSATRLVHFGLLPQELKRKHDAVIRVDAAFIANTKPGARVGDIFSRAQKEYANTGFAGEWKLHHQGGPTGYKGREFKAYSGTDLIVVENQAYAWNPSITGTKSEDTIIATTDGPKILSLIDSWPAVQVEADGMALERPDILVR